MTLSKAMPDVRTIQKLAQVFNVSVEELMKGTDPNSKMGLGSVP